LNNNVNDDYDDLKVSIKNKNYIIQNTKKKGGAKKKNKKNIVKKEET